jgi:thiamine-phosphate pyrophosphorylase
MEMVLITDPELLEGEQELIADLFGQGLKDLHLRKYDATEQELLDFLKRIPEEYHSRIVLHHHHYLVRKFNVKGVHFNSYTKDIEQFPKGQLLFSRAVHDPTLLPDVESSVDRVLLSPIYPTISKGGNEAPIPSKELEKWVQGRTHPFELIALGGIDPEKVQEIGRMGFDGFAVLGGIWEVFKNEGEDAARSRFEAFQAAIAEWPTQV